MDSPRSETPRPLECQQQQQQQQQQKHRQPPSSPPPQPPPQPPRHHRQELHQIDYCHRRTPSPRARYDAPHTDAPRKNSLTSPARRPTGRHRSLTEILLDHDHYAGTTLLFTGIDPTWMQTNRPDMAPDYTPRYAAVQRLQRATGLHVEVHVLAPDSAGNVVELRRKIRDGAGPEGGHRAWDGVVFTWELRVVAELSDLFADLVNYVHDTLPGARMLLPPVPKSEDDYLELVERTLGVDLGYI